VLLFVASILVVITWRMIIFLVATAIGVDLSASQGGVGSHPVEPPLDHERGEQEQRGDDGPGQAIGALNRWQRDVPSCDVGDAQQLGVPCPRRSARTRSSSRSTPLGPVGIEGALLRSLGEQPFQASRPRRSAARVVGGRTGRPDRASRRRVSAADEGMLSRTPSTGTRWRPDGWRMPPSRSLISTL
jgi:hypothetical protein